MLGGLLTAKKVSYGFGPPSGGRSPAARGWLVGVTLPDVKRGARLGPGQPTRVGQSWPGLALQLSLFDQQNLVEIGHPDYPGERLVWFT